MKKPVCYGVRRYKGQCQVKTRHGWLFVGFAWEDVTIICQYLMTGTV